MNLSIFYRICNCKSLKFVYFLLRLYYVYISSVNVVFFYLIGTLVREWLCGRWRRFWIVVVVLRGGVVLLYFVFLGYRFLASWCRFWYILILV